MDSSVPTPLWQSIAIIVGRLIFAGLFIMAATFKFLDPAGTATYIAATGIPASQFLAWVAAIFESLLALGFLTGAFFSEVSLLAAAYVLFLAITFHGPSHWAGNQS